MNGNGTAAQLILQIIQREMALSSRSFWLRDQNKTIPNDHGLYVVAGMIGSMPIASVSKIRTALPSDWDGENQVWDIAGQQFDVGGNPYNYDRSGEFWDQPNQTFDQLPPTMIETNEVQARETIQIDILSRSNDALMRNWEIIAALKSIFSQQTQEANDFKIFRIPQSFVNTSSAEGGSQLNRYTLTFPAFVWYRKAKVLTNAGINGGDYYDDFRQRVDDEKSIGTTVPIIQFEINQEGIEP